MYIGNIMRTDLITVAPKTTLVEAKELLEKHRTVKRFEMRRIAKSYACQLFRWEATYRR